MENYFMEAYVNQRRDRVLQEVQDYYADPATAAHLEAAVEESRALMQQEYYAMKLVCLASGLSELYIPPEVDAVVLASEDMRLSADQMLQRAQLLLYDTQYQQAKEKIYANLNSAVENVVNIMQEKHDSSVDDFFKAVYFQRVAISILILLNVLMFMVILLMITIPLKHFRQRIRERTLLDVRGVRELQELACVYNEMYETTATNAAQFKYRPENVN